MLPSALRRLVLRLAVVAFGAVVATVGAGARGEPTTDDATTSDGPQVRSGLVRQYLVDEFGDVGGVIAADGLQVRFPPHMGADLVRTLKPGDRFVAHGVDEDGDHRFRAYALGRPDAAPLIESRPTGAAPPSRDRRVATLVAMSVDGRIALLLSGPRGDVDGVVLDDGTIVRLPPPGLPDPASPKVGMRLVAEGLGTRNAYGRALRADRVGLDGGPILALQPRGPVRPPPPGAPRPPPR